MYFHHLTTHFKNSNCQMFPIRSRRSFLLNVSVETTEWNYATRSASGVENIKTSASNFCLVLIIISDNYPTFPASIFNALINYKLSFPKFCILELCNCVLFLSHERFILNSIKIGLWLVIEWFKILLIEAVLQRGFYKKMF